MAPDRGALNKINFENKAGVDFENDDALISVGISLNGATYGCCSILETKKENKRNDYPIGKTDYEGKKMTVESIYLEERHIAS